MITHLPSAEHIAVPWKNGGGVTREIAVFPIDAGMDDFLWRISMAEVTEAGPFSRFDGIDRHLTVLEGRLRLDLPDRRYPLFPGESLAFEGDTPVTGTPLTTRVLDLNIMTRQGRFTAEVEHITGPAEIQATFIIALEPTRIAGFDLLPYDALRIEKDAILTLDHSRAAIIRLPEV